MKLNYILGVLGILFFLQIISCKTQNASFNYLAYTKTPAEIEQTEQRIERIYYSLLGHFSNKKQGDTARSKLYQAQDLISVPIWRKRKGEYWLYMGRFKKNFMDNPIVEGIFRVWRINTDTTGLQFYELPPNSSGDFKGEWKQESPFKDFSPSDLSSNNDCISYIVKKDDNAFEILPNKHPCSFDLSYQIHYFDISGRVTPELFYYSGSYYDENQVPILQYPSYNGLIFERMDKDKPEY